PGNEPHWLSYCVCRFARYLESDCGHRFRFPAAQSRGGFEAYGVSPGSANAAGKMEHSHTCSASERHWTRCSSFQQAASAGGSPAFMGNGKHASEETRVRAA